MEQKWQQRQELELLFFVSSLAQPQYRVAWLTDIRGKPSLGYQAALTWAHGVLGEVSQVLCWPFQQAYEQMESTLFFSPLLPVSNLKRGVFVWNCKPICILHFLYSHKSKQILPPSPSFCRHLLLDFSFCAHQIWSLLHELLQRVGCFQQSTGIPGVQTCDPIPPASAPAGIAALYPSMGSDFVLQLLISVNNGWK